MILPYLPDVVVTPMHAYGYEFDIHWRPMDLLDKSKWADACRVAECSTFSTEARYYGLAQQIIAIPGLKVQVSEDGGKTMQEVLFDPTKHVRNLPIGCQTPLWEKMMTMADLAEADVKNSEWPSAPSEVSGTATSPAEPVQKPNETNSTAS